MATNESAGDRPGGRCLQGAGAEAMRRLHDDRDHRRLDGGEGAGHRRQRPERDVDPGQRDEDDERRQDEQAAGDEAAPRAVQQPADVGGELLRLGARQHHAVRERVQEAALADPAPLLDQRAMHDRDLAGGSAEADEPQLEPEPCRLAQAG